MKFSTGRGAKMRHSTGMEWDELKKAKKKYTPVKHSTGEEANIKHSTGIEFDYKHLAESTAKQSFRTDAEGAADVHSKVRSKPKLEGEEYLELYQKSITQGKKEDKRKKR